MIMPINKTEQSYRRRDSVHLRDEPDGVVPQITMPVFSQVTCRRKRKMLIDIKVQMNAAEMCTDRQTGQVQAVLYS